MLKAAIIVVDDLAVNTDLPQGIINTAMNKELPVGDGLVRNGLNQARVIIPDAGLIDPFRDRPHA
jgi:predicted DNA repair protein MutK